MKEKKFVSDSLSHRTYSYTNSYTPGLIKIKRKAHVHNFGTIFTKAYLGHHKIDLSYLHILM